MTIFDKACAVAACLLGVLLVLLGIFGLFAGCSANFSLPPVLGVIPAFVGWGIVRPVYVAWTHSNRSDALQHHPVPDDPEFDELR